MHQAAMEHSSLSRQRLDLVHAGNSTTTTIPFDLITEILSRLPGKLLFRFQSVSKLWFSTIRSKFFVDLFLTRSKTRPRLLFTLDHSDSQKKLIFSAPEHTYNNDDDKSSSSVMARHDMTILEPSDYLISGSVNGFLCFRSDVCYKIIVYNPTTRQIVKLPDVEPKGRYMDAYLGYDPVEDQYKVLRMTRSGRKNKQQEHFVCTVSSSQKQEWRKIENPTGDSYSYVCGETCIDGALYYGVGESRIVRFDVRYEKIDFIKIPKLESYIPTTDGSKLINYKGKLADLEYSFTKKLMTLWVLENAEKQEWSSMKCVLPSKWQDLPKTHLMSQGVIHTGELMVFSPFLDSSKPFYVCYYDYNKKIRKVEIQGMEDGDFRHIHGTDWMLCYPGHIENIKFLQGIYYYYYYYYYSIQFDS